MKNRLFIILLLIICTPSPAQSPDTLWTKIFGGLENDVGKSISQTNDGGFIITG